MSIKFRCPGCNRKLAAEVEDVGAVTECPDCSTEIMIPEPPADGGLPIAEKVVPPPVAKPVIGLMDRVETVTRSIKAQRQAAADQAKQAGEQDSSGKDQATSKATAPGYQTKVRAPVLRKPTIKDGDAKKSAVSMPKLTKPNLNKKTSPGFTASQVKTPGGITKAPAIKAPSIAKKDVKTEESGDKTVPSSMIQSKEAPGVIKPIKPVAPKTIAPPSSGASQPPTLSHPSYKPKKPVEGTQENAEPARTPPALPKQPETAEKCPNCGAGLSMPDAVICIECGHQLKEVKKSKAGFFGRRGKRK